MSRRRTTVVSYLLGAALVLGATACDTTYDSSISTTTEAPAESAPASTLPSGTAAELLPLLLAEVQALPNRVATNDGSGAAATRIENLWAAVRPEIEANQPALVPDFEFVVRRCRAAADRKRPADADRAFKNLTALVDAYLG
jgi:hypothetical protein